MDSYYPPSEKTILEPDKENQIFLNDLANLSGAELLRRWKQGDARAADYIVERYAIRLVAMISAKMNRRFQREVDPEDVVQSALGSFFLAARESRIQVSRTLSLWRLLATFAKRKMLRSIERQLAQKRGGDRNKVNLENLLEYWVSDPEPDSLPSTEEWFSELDLNVSADLRELLERILLGETQKEMAEYFGVTERTIRRRSTRLYKSLSRQKYSIVNKEEVEAVSSVLPSLPRVNYNEFVLGRMVGSGGFGKVYRATLQSNAHKIVAVKFLRKAYWKDPEAKRVFLREVDQAGKVQHPAVVRYLGWGESPHGGPYVITQWIDGNPLLHIRSELSSIAFVETLRSICEGLKAVHQLGMVHGDLTPSNILVNGSNQAWIVDFGFSQSWQQCEIETNSPRGGTIGFAAPEQVSEAFGRIGPMTDVYAVGGLAYWFLTGRPPHGESFAGLSLLKTIESSDTKVSEIETQSSADVLIRKIASVGLKKAQNDRPADVNVFLDLMK